MHATDLYHHGKTLGGRAAREFCDEDTLLRLRQFRTNFDSEQWANWKIAIEQEHGAAVAVFLACESDERIDLLNEMYRGVLECETNQTRNQYAVADALEWWGSLIDSPWEIDNEMEQYPTVEECAMLLQSAFVRGFVDGATQES